MHQPRITLFANKSYSRLVNPAINISVIPLAQTAALAQTNKPEQRSYSRIKLVENKVNTRRNMLGEHARQACSPSMFFKYTRQNKQLANIWKKHIYFSFSEFAPPIPHSSQLLGFLQNSIKILS